MFEMVFGIEAGMVCSVELQIRGYVDVGQGGCSPKPPP